MSTTLSPQRWQKINQLFLAAVEYNADERRQFLATACAGDETLRAEVEKMLHADALANSFLERSPINHTTAPKQSRATKGAELGKYRLLEEIGAGGMGAVFRAFDTQLEREVAIKFLSTDLAFEPARLERFAREAKAASALNHPNILTIHEIGQHEQTPYIVTELVEGDTLRALLAKKQLSIAESVALAVQIATALQAAHENGIIHRDIKPENIMVRPDGLVKILDFGLAKLSESMSAERGTRNEESDALRQAAPDIPPSSFRAHTFTTPGIVMGTVRYMSPEQARGVTVDARSDLFSLGIVLYEMLTGRPPFQGMTHTDVMVALVDKEPATLSQYVSQVPDELQKIVTKALTKDVTLRYQTSAEIVADLQNLQRTYDLPSEVLNVRSTARQSVTAATTQSNTSLEYIVTQIKQHKKGVSIAFALIAVSVLLGSWFLFHKRTYALSEKDTVLVADFVNNTGEPIFDGALKQAFSVQVEQTPFLNIFSEERVAETLRFMSRKPDEKITREIAREICLRRGVKAVLLGTITKFDQNYGLTLQAVNAQNGEVFASTLSEAKGKDDVLRALGKATNDLRAQLGESLQSIQHFAAPSEQGTTASLDALQAVSLARTQFLLGQRLEAIALYKRALEFDPNFALSYARLANIYDGLGQAKLAAEFAQKAFALRANTSEREKFLISSFYFDYVTGETNKDIELLKLWAQTYPRDVFPRNSLTVRYLMLGQYDAGIAEAKEAIQVDPSYVFPYGNMAAAQLRSSHFDDAIATLTDAQSRKLDSLFYRAIYFRAGFAKGDQNLMNLQLERSTGKPDEFSSLSWLSQGQAAQGKMRAAHETIERSIILAEQRSLTEVAHALAVEAALRQNLAGHKKLALAESHRLLQKFPANFTRSFHSSLLPPIGPLTFALAGDIAQAQKLIDETNQINPNNLLTQTVWLPIARAAIELEKHNPAKAIDLLAAAVPYDAASIFFPTWLRAQAYLQNKQGKEAAAEFQKIIANPGWEPLSMLYPLAHLGLARAYALQQEKSSSQKYYEEFFERWKEADADLPVLLEAKQEYAQLIKK